MLLEKRNNNFIQLAKHLDDDKVCVYPCDTIYGLIGKSPTTKDQIYALKNRHEDFPLIQYAYSVAQIEDDIQQTITSSLTEYWPGEISLIFQRKDESSQAYRIPQDEWLLEYMQSRHTFLYTTSANEHLSPSLTHIQDIQGCFGAKIDLYIKDSACEGKQIASTLIDLRAESPVILRQGNLNISLPTA